MTRRNNCKLRDVYLGMAAALAVSAAGTAGAAEPGHQPAADAHGANVAAAAGAANGHGAPAVGRGAPRVTPAAAVGGHGAPVGGRVAPAGGHGGASPWGYDGPAGPSSWGTLTADYHACAAGQTQSPIDIATVDGASAFPIEFDYRLTPLNIVHNGHTVQVNYGPGSGITVGGERFELLQLHFHTPSEHAVAGKRAAMEAHFVHKNEAGELAVVGVLMNSAEENMALREIWDNLPQQAGPEQVYENVLIKPAICCRKAPASIATWVR